MLAHLRRRPFLYLSIALHAALLAGLYGLDFAGRHRIESARQQQAIESGRRLTAQARLEKRVHDMARIKSLLEQDPAASDDKEAQFSSAPRAPGELLEEARELSRAIDGIARATRAEQLAKLLGISKEKALEQLAGTSKPEQAPDKAPGNPEDAAKTIEGLEAKARALLEQRRRQLTIDAGQGLVLGHGASNRGKTDGTSLSAVLDRMDAFAHPDKPEQATQAYTSWGEHDFFGRGEGHIPAVDVGATVKGAGRIVGAGGTYANRVYVNSWYLIGPFEGKHGEDLFSNNRHPPEDGVVLDAAYRGKDGRLLKWEYVDMAAYPFIPPEAEEDAVYYGYTELRLDQEQDLTIWVGADDDAQLWLNDSLVWQGGKHDKRWFFGAAYDGWNTNVRAYNLTEGKRVVHFRKGRNKLFFKLANGPTRLFFSLVLTK